jgi:hypothetical protein
MVPVLILIAVAIVIAVPAKMSQEELDRLEA